MEKTSKRVETHLKYAFNVARKATVSFPSTSKINIFPFFFMLALERVVAGFRVSGSNAL
jgi:hypothetical protein